ncbi:hypothetical protein Pmar_PMAR001860 [Perkinsus marinus ATCC 50983]|uniref:Uncharacterized protein n=1 Tax=Perkinsus marinus (strain ATCC 50983 / TXsc) TaxID=423536 RepID=C5KYQ6_PERM5|nr:hypothetical protein Pmar_PMAR001860 [Perkinsus marinus ATCC 50983]EER10387.1 hypothetical protein Pmar_PMAR001860 [Perkinsus marinus ATCC 50983]|eukprot:XP_002778592.1 hypothetical protein Pmar_PMAR001860 [Perkinsus marinus ATCC 50983]
MKLYICLLGCLAIGQLNEGVVLRGLKYPSNQLYGPVSSNNDCPMVNSIKQYPAKYYKDPHYTVCMPITPDWNGCPPTHAKASAVHDGNIPVCLIPCETDTDCQQEATCFSTGTHKLCVFHSLQ